MVCSELMISSNHLDERNVFRSSICALPTINYEYEKRANQKQRSNIGLTTWNTNISWFNRLQTVQLSRNWKKDIYKFVWDKWECRYDRHKTQSAFCNMQERHNEKAKTARLIVCFIALFIWGFFVLISWIFQIIQLCKRLSIECLVIVLVNNK